MLWKRNGTEIDDNGEKFVYQHHSVGQEQVLILEIHNISVSVFKFSPITTNVVSLNPTRYVVLTLLNQWWKNL